jgi:hypothetical protein
MDQTIVDDLNRTYRETTEDYEKTKYHRARFHRVRRGAFWVFFVVYISLIITYLFWRNDSLGWLLAIAGLFFFFEKHMAENRLDRYLRMDLDLGYNMLKSFHQKINELHDADLLRDSGKTTKPK